MAQIRKAFDWIGRVFDIRGPRRAPVEIQDEYRATFDVFGTHRMGEMQVQSIFITQGGAPGALELAHTEVPQGFWRMYLSMEVWQNNATSQILAMARIVPTGVSPGFPIARFTSEFLAAQDIRIAFTFLQLGPGSFLAVEGRNVAAGTRVDMTMVWLELPLGESFHVL